MGHALSTVPFNTDPANWDHGAIVNYYSNNFYLVARARTITGHSCVKRLNSRQRLLPGQLHFRSLNRLTSISEKTNGTDADTFKQAYPMTAGAIAPSIKRDTENVPIQLHRRRHD